MPLYPIYPPPVFGLPVKAPNITQSFSFPASSLQRLGNSNTTMYRTLTACAWVKPLSTGSSAGMAVISKRSYFANATTDFPFEIQLNGAGTTALAFIDSGNDFSFDLQVSSGTFTNNAWHFIAATYNNPTLTLWVDGAITTATGAVSAALNAEPWTIGNSAADGGSGGANQLLYKGLIFRPRVYNVAKTASQLFAMQQGFDDQVGLQVQWTDVLPPTFQN